MKWSAFEEGLFQTAVERWGEVAQVFMVVEEVGEVLTAMAQYFRGRVTGKDLAGEVADALIMLGQLRSMVGPELVDRVAAEKLERLRNRLEGGDVSQSDLQGTQVSAHIRTPQISEKKERKKEKNQKKERKKESSSVSYINNKTTVVNNTSTDLVSEIRDLKARYSDTNLHIINTTLKAIAETRKTGRIAPSVVRGILRKWADVSVEAVVEGCQRYLDRGYAAEGKAEAYLWAIIRGVTEDHQRQADSYRQPNLQARPRPRPDQDYDRPIPPTFDPEAKAKADAERDRIFDAWKTTVLEALEKADKATRAEIEQRAQKRIAAFPLPLQAKNHHLLAAAKVEIAAEVLGIRRPS